MTPREQTAFHAGIEAARQMALTAAVTIEARDDAGEVRQQAAVAALAGLADGLKAAFLDPRAEPSPAHLTIAAVEAELGAAGEIPRPACAGRLRWVRDSDNGHLSGECETAGCLAWIQ